MHFFYVKLPIGPGLDQREREFHEQLELALTQSALGSLLSWGNSWAHSPGGAPARLAFHRIDIEIEDLPGGLALLQRRLEALAAPMGTEIHYTRAGRAMQDVSSPVGWRTEPCSQV